MLKTIHLQTKSRTEFLDITGEVEAALRGADVDEGICHIFIPHTTAAVTINENADPSVPRDILAQINRVIPFEGDYHHTEGNSAAHIKSSLIGCSEAVLVERGKLLLGTWQGIFFCEFDGPRSRKVMVSIR